MHHLTEEDLLEIYAQLLGVAADAEHEAKRGEELDRKASEITGEPLAGIGQTDRRREAHFKALAAKILDEWRAITLIP